MKEKQVRMFRRNLRRFERLNQLANEACCSGITLAQCHVLLEVENLGETTTKQLSENLKLDKSTLSRTVYGLKKGGFIRTREHAIDRRFTRINLSVKGKAKCKSLNEFNDALYEGILRQLNQKERRGFCHRFALIVEAMSAFCRRERLC